MLNTQVELFKTIPQVIRYAALKWPKQPAIKVGDEIITYEQQYEKICSLAKGLQNLGLKKGDHIATLIGGYKEWFYLSYAISMIGGVIVPINVTFKERELEYVLRQADVKALVTMDNFRGVDYIEMLNNIIPEINHSQTGFLSSTKFPKLDTLIVFNTITKKNYNGFFNLSDVSNSGVNFYEDEINRLIEAIDPNDTSHILFTSGSTAFPKPALRSHSSNIGIAHYLYANSYRINQDDILLGYLPFYHVGGCVYFTLGPALAGATIILMEYYNPKEALQLIEREKVTCLGGFDTHFKTLTEQPEFNMTDLSSVKKIQLACGPEWYTKVKEFGFHRELTASHHYGLTEGTSVVMPLEEEDENIRKYSNGKPFPGVSIKIIDPETKKECEPNIPGEICIKGWNLFKGYYKMPVETAKSFDDEGYFHTGDYGWKNESGYIYYRGRYKQMIKTGGENVSEREVEMFLENHADVKAVQVVGTPDSVWGEVVTAVIETHSGNELTVEEIKTFCKDKIAGFKIPKYVVNVSDSEWPVTPTGKYIKKEIKELAINKLNSNIV